MALLPWRSREQWPELFPDLERIHDEINRLFALSFPDLRERTAALMERIWRPAVDIYECDDNFIIKADLPGLKKEDIDISVQGDTLIVKGEKKQEREVKEKDYLRSERFYGSFQRVIPLPSEVDADRVGATYKDGVLEITLPKKEEAKPKKLKIEVK